MNNTTNVNVTYNYERILNSTQHVVRLSLNVVLGTLSDAVPAFISPVHAQPPASGFLSLAITVYHASAGLRAPAGLKYTLKTSVRAPARSSAQARRGCLLFVKRR